MFKTQISSLPKADLCYSTFFRRHSVDDVDNCTNGKDIVDFIPGLILFARLYRLKSRDLGNARQFYSFASEIASNVITVMRFFPLL